MNTTVQEYSTASGAAAMSAPSDTDAGRVFAAFRERNTTARAWALANGWRPASVYMVIAQWIEHPVRRGRMPLGGINRAILAALRLELGGTIVPLNEMVGRQHMERVA